MDLGIQRNIEQPERPLTREDVEALLREAGSSAQLNLSRRNLQGIDLAFFSLSGANLSWSRLIKARLVGVDLSLADLTGVDFEGSDLREAHLEKATLERAILDNANLSGANLSGAYLRSTILKEANLGKATLKGATIRSSTTTEDASGRADLRGIRLGGADLVGVDLVGVDLEGAHLEGAYLEGADLEGADLRGAYLEGAHLEDIDLRSAYLEGAHLGSADLRGAYLEGAHLEGADLRGAYLEGAHLEGADLRGAYLQDADVWDALVDAVSGEAAGIVGQEELTVNSEVATEGRPDVSKRRSDVSEDMSFVSGITGETIHFQVKAPSESISDLVTESVSDLVKKVSALPQQQQSGLVQTISALPQQQQFALYKTILDLIEPDAFEIWVESLLGRLLPPLQQSKSEEKGRRAWRYLASLERGVQGQEDVGFVPEMPSSLRMRREGVGETKEGSYVPAHEVSPAQPGKEFARQGIYELLASLLSDYARAYADLEQKYAQVLTGFTRDQRSPSPSQDTPTIAIPAFLKKGDGEPGASSEETAQRLMPVGTTVRVEVDEDPLTVEQVGTLFRTLSTLTTKYWLLSQGRFADLIEFSKSHDERFLREAQAVITRISYNSPLNFDIKLSATDVAQGITTTIDGIVQGRQRLKQMDLVTKTKELELQQAEQRFAEELGRTQQQEAFEQEKRQLELAKQQVELERFRLEVEQQRLAVFEARLDAQRKSMDHAFEIAHKVIGQLHPQADDATKRMLVQTYVSEVLQLSGIAFKSVTIIEEDQTPLPPEKN